MGKAAFHAHIGNPNIDGLYQFVCTLDDTDYVTGTTYVSMCILFLKRWYIFLKKAFFMNFVLKI